MQENLSKIHKFLPPGPIGLFGFEGFQIWQHLRPELFAAMALVIADEMGDSMLREMGLRESTWKSVRSLTNYELKRIGSLPSQVVNQLLNWISCQLYILSVYITSKITWIQYIAHDCLI